ncbi:alpha/beta hydrolase family protein [Mycobacterium ulcerans str. Harvey]|uniref:Alpha/beta hydrolase family protein n=1 Tax=Mycobacterium ulcerans str. Harvey TaxID=1299332 RepID=A0ABN0QVL8_MYCUL|nr:alpha/beta hydrolase family protein [Mycobacterium ulcerans str. Harvey]
MKVQSELAALRNAAAAAELQIDALSSRVVPIAGLRHTESEWARVLAKQAELQADLGAIVVEANTIDEELASAVNMADGDSPIPAEAGAPVGPEGLTPTQRASDANEELLREERAKLRARIGQLQGRYDQLAARAASDYNNGILDSDAMGQLAALGDQLTAAKGRLGDLDAVDQALRNAPETYLAQLRVPDDPHQQVLAAVAVGNPDTAANVSVTVPGVGSTTRGTLPGMVTEARNLQSEEMRQLKNAGKPTSVAAIAWMGYEPPPNPLDTATAGDLWQTMTDGQARAGAGDLSRYLQQVRANNPSGHLTVLGHSYGSLTASLALQDLNAHGAHPVNDVVFYGSPGLELYSPAQLGLEHGHAYVMQAPHDLITGVVARWPRCTVGAGPVSDSRLDGVVVTGRFRSRWDLAGRVYARGDYPRVFQDAAGQPQLRMSGYNLAAIAAGLPDNKVGAPLLPPVLGGGMPAAPGHVLAGGH